jgi:DNA modification methylase
MMTNSLKIEVRRIADLVPYDRNPRTHTDQQVAQIAASISTFGWTNPILIGPDNVIIAGHARWLAARQLELVEVPVVVLDGLTKAQRKALVIADNRLALNAGWDEEMLRLELEELRLDDFDVDLLGFDSEDLEQLWADENVLSDGRADAAPEPQEQVVSRPGDLWRLGSHRLLCGDATLRSDVEHLMLREKADLMFCDSSYNVDYEGYTQDRLKIQGDRMNAEQFRTFLGLAFGSYRAAAKSHASLYVFHASSWQREVQGALEAAGFEIRCQLIWAENTFAWGFGRYKFQHEPIFYCHLAGESDAWYGDKTQSTLWVESKPAANRRHSTMKPVEAIERALVNSSRRGDRVVDLFGGSGSTLIACERTRRVACLMEIDPRYGDVIVRRWQEFTGKQALLEDTGSSFEAVERERTPVTEEGGSSCEPFASGQDTEVSL